ncbi:hypothetical protein AB0I77_45710 [Streptomyces sp. NPDC050619]|uniref:hypothetical protein n=1 Tax=Streptomyces sp. NPDC050619 TaxID=3157214 RepID=UPI0034455AF7
MTAIREGGLVEPSITLVWAASARRGLLVRRVEAELVRGQFRGGQLSSARGATARARARCGPSRSGSSYASAGSGRMACVLDPVQAACQLRGTADEMVSGRVV